MIKLICTDIDGTLVPDGTNKINPELFEVVRQLKQKGIMFVAASGRQYASMRDLFSSVAQDMIFISEGGNLVMCREEIMAMSRMQPDMVKELIADIEAIEGCDALMSEPMVSYAKKASKELCKLMVEGYHYSLEEVDNLNHAVTDQIIKVALYQKDRRADEVLEQKMYPKWKNHEKVELVCAGEEWIDCINRGSNKGTAIAQIQRIMRIEPSETMVFGDNLNDLSMLKRADYSFAVGNARDEVKEAARFVADTNVKDGVLKEIKKLLDSLE